jgi:hypothetical protein
MSQPADRSLPPLPLTEWEPAKITLHLWTRIVGKIKLFDFIDHRLQVLTGEGPEASFELHDGLTVAEFDEQLHWRLATLDVDVQILEHPFGIPSWCPAPTVLEDLVG